MIRTAGSLKLGKVQASVLVRSLLKSERPSGLTQAIIEVGRINKTLYLLNYIDDEDYRRRILTQLNRGESRHAVARAICHGQKGEIRKRYTDGQEDQLGALGLVTNAVVLWNTIYMQAALDHLRAQGETLNDEDIARLSPLCHGHEYVRNNRLPEPVIRVKQPALARFSPDISPLFVHFRADDDVTARLYARGYRLRPEFFKWRKIVLRPTPIMRAVARHPTPFMAISMIFWCVPG